MNRPGPSPTARVVRVALGCAAWALLPLSAHAQDIGDPARLAGIEGVAVRATADWDELITNTAGGATGAQFEEALLLGFEQALRDATAGPQVTPGAPNFVTCHVDTFYDSGLIVYSVRVTHNEPDADGRSVITWLHSSVGSYTAQQLHVIWTLGDQCADAFTSAWSEANPG